MSFIFRWGPLKWGGAHGPHDRKEESPDLLFITGNLDTGDLCCAPRVHLCLGIQVSTSLTSTHPTGPFDQSLKGSFRLWPHEATQPNWLAPRYWTNFFPFHWSDVWRYNEVSRVRQLTRMASLTCGHVDWQKGLVYGRLRAKPRTRVQIVTGLEEHRK